MANKPTDPIRSGNGKILPNCVRLLAKAATRYTNKETNVVNQPSAVVLSLGHFPDVTIFKSSTEPFILVKPSVLAKQDQ